MIPSVSFIGGGNMASAIISGIESQFPKCPIHICDRGMIRRQTHIEAGRLTYTSIADAIQNSKIIFLAIKPKDFKIVAAELSQFMTNQLIISILAGITVAQIESALPDKTRVIRCMPNTPIAIGQGMVGISSGTYCTDYDIDICTQIFEPSAAVLKVTENKMNAITAISGSGPAYFFQFCESLLSAAENLGFTNDEAQLLVSQTARGSINYLCSQDNFPAATLRKQVTSKGGTTEAALQHMHSMDFTDIICGALKAAENRGFELSQES